MKTTYRFILVLLASLLLLVSCQNSTSNQESDTIKVGVIGPLSGNVAFYGISSINGVKMAAEEINKAGGINGKLIELLIEDDKGDNTEAVNAYNKLVDQGVVAIIGAITSAPSEAIASLAQNDGIPMITPTGTQLNITENRKNVFRVCFTDPFQGEKLAQYVYNEQPDAKIALMKNNSSNYSDGVFAAFKAKAEELKLNVVGEESYGADDKDFRAQLTNLIALNPDIILVPDYFQINALIVSQARELGYKNQFIGPDGWDGILAQVEESSYPTLNGTIFTNHYSLHDETKIIADFVNNYRGQYNEDPSAFSALSYDAVYLLKNAIENAKSLEKEAIVDALHHISFTGVTGALTFDDQNNPVKAVSIIEVRDGQYTLQQVLQPEN